MLITGLLLVLAYIVYVSLRPAAVGSTVANAVDMSFQPLAVENPALRLDLLTDLKKLEYQGSQRNIFSAAPPPPPPPSAARRRRPRPRPQPRRSRLQGRLRRLR